MHGTWAKKRAKARLGFLISKVEMRALVTDSGSQISWMTA